VYIRGARESELRSNSGAWLGTTRGTVSHEIGSDVCGVELSDDFTPHVPRCHWEGRAIRGGQSAVPGTTSSLTDLGPFPEVVRGRSSRIGWPWQGLADVGVGRHDQTEGAGWPSPREVVITAGR